MPSSLICHTSGSLCTSMPFDTPSANNTRVWANSHTWGPAVIADVPHQRVAVHQQALRHRERQGPYNAKNAKKNVNCLCWSSCVS